MTERSSCSPASPAFFSRFSRFSRKCTYMPFRSQRTRRVEANWKVEGVKSVLDNCRTRKTMIPHLLHVQSASFSSLRESGGNNCAVGFRNIESKWHLPRPTIAGTSGKRANLPVCPFLFLRRVLLHRQSASARIRQSTAFCV